MIIIAHMIGEIDIEADNDPNLFIKPAYDYIEILVQKIYF